MLIHMLLWAQPKMLARDCIDIFTVAIQFKSTQLGVDRNCGHRSGLTTYRDRRTAERGKMALISLFTRRVSTTDPIFKSLKFQICRFLE